MRTHFVQTGVAAALPDTTPAAWARRSKPGRNFKLHPDGPTCYIRSK
jgi:hypothetical protein